MADISAEHLTGEAAVAPAASWRSRRWLLLTIAVVVLGLLGLLLWWGVRRGPNADVGKTVPLNKPAPAFSVTTIDGKPLSLADLRGKVVVLNMWASWCVPCQEESQELNRAYALYKDRNVAFVGIAWNDDDGQVQQFVKRYQVPYAVALDPEGRIAIDLGITGVPETFLIDPQGQLVEKWVGPVTSARLGELLAPMVR